MSKKFSRVAMREMLKKDFSRHKDQQLLAELCGMIRQVMEEYQVQYQCLCDVQKDRLFWENETKRLRVKIEELESALAQFISRHEAGLLPCRFTYEKAREALAAVEGKGEE